MARSHERRTERATAEEITEVERQLWEFVKRIDPPSVPEAKLRPGAFLYRVHRAWHSLGRGTGGLASRSFRALKDELLRRDPPVRGLQPKIYGNTALSHAEAEQLIDVMLETWHLERNRSGKWQARPLTHPDNTKSASRQDLETARENLLHTLFKGDEYLLLEEPVGVPPEIFMKERGQSSVALIIPTKSETTAHLSPSNAYGGFSSLVGNFFDAVFERKKMGQPLPILIWALRISAIRDNANFHQDFHCLNLYSASITNWYLRLSRKHGEDRKSAEEYWKIFMQRSAFFIHGLPNWVTSDELDKNSEIDEDLADLSPDDFVPYSLPIVLSNHRLVKRQPHQGFTLNVSIEHDATSERPPSGTLKYWLLPEQPKGDLGETEETTGLPVSDAEISPGRDYDIAFISIYEAVAYKLGLMDDHRSRLSFNTLSRMGWKALRATQLQQCLRAKEELTVGCASKVR